ncbi:ribonuclease Z [Flavobacterium sp. SM2513]|uniref:ribonuclease Z n=1 Tax=Flavobacterium sp. SM2513 TaxID=3424766 RepID=UPI003D7F1CBC
MKFTTKGHATTIRDTQNDLGQFISRLTYDINNYKGTNLIIDLSNYGTIEDKHLLLFQPLSTEHKRNKKSFVLVVSATDFNAFPEEFVVVPSLLEANDIIAMDEIERDLGF